MELRKDPITRSWVITGDDAPPGPSASEVTPAGAEAAPGEDPVCLFCPTTPQTLQIVSTLPALDGGPWSARAVVHPSPLYHVEGDPGRQGSGIYDKMNAVGAHEVLVENACHDHHLWNAADGEIEQFLLLAAQRVLDLKRDERFKYVSVFKDYGHVAGQEFEHPTSQMIASTFVPRRILYELRASREYFANKERCVFCDILAQEERQALRIVDTRGDYVAFCPYAPRVPFETWLISRTHEASFERFAISRQGALRDMAALVRHTLNRIRSIADGFHMVLHTAPNTLHRSRTLGYWKTIDDDYHWHIEILPILASKMKSYTVKEVYFSPVTPETAASKLREASPE